ncbi:ABC transporter substrate-binding protein [Burkholderia gladioli pv. gladioli]|nr:ABC transporter substrate-binding protein [Burkholderia gladioli]AJW99336.1 substrate binding domain of ABC-type glycine betaine transport system family protein [Burkholderia gladioli]KGC11641.1 substrate binding domain of ABC-type glycine betaine transport system family protein [Burkholderia gladioli]MDJ1164114.1 ABC transporter substrate-binding protein [Burkholderia gladioli pv. gladioli]QPQ84265.1 ABC transporter substrate-binding protein [Burkholderia gladioli]
MLKKLCIAMCSAAMATAMLVPVQATGNPLSSDGKSAAGGSLVVGSADFPESELLATIFAQALRAKGINADVKLNIGSREVYMPALLDGSISVIPEYTGATLSYLDRNASAHTPEDVAKALAAALPKQIAMLAYSKAEDTDVLAVTQATAKKYSLTSISDLGPVADQLVLGGPPEWKTRREGVVGLKEVYGVTFKSFRTLDVAGPITLSALKNGQVQAADMTSTDPAMKQDKLIALKDRKNLFPAQNIVPLVAKDRLNDKIQQVLNQVSSALTTDDLVVMNARLAKQESFDTVAADWLKAKGLGR